VELKKIKVTGVGGLPTGINVSFDKPQAPYLGYYDVTAGDSLGCGSFCGTPLAAGVYPITIYIEANVLAVGTPIGNVDPGPQNQTYVDTMIILPDTSGAVSSFTYTPQIKSDCDSLRLTFDAILSAQSPNPTSYDWNFGNGNRSSLKNPSGNQFYNTPGIYPVSLQTIYYKYRVKRIFITAISGGYSPDIEELTTLQNPDPFVKIGALGYTSNTVNDTKNNISYDNVNLVLPFGTDTFQMQVWDKDNGPPLGSADDLIGTYTIRVIPGLTQYNWQSGNAYGYVEFDTVFGTKIVDTLRVNIQGRPAKPYLVADKDSACDGDSIKLTIRPSYSNVKYEWWKDSTFIVGASDSVLYTNTSGGFYVKVTNLTTGCSQTMDTPSKRVAISPYFPSSFSIIYDGGSRQFFLNPYPSSAMAVWTYNNQIVSGQNGRFLPWLGDGVYSANVYPAGFPNCAVQTPNYVQAGIDDQTSDDLSELSVYPNPNKGTFSVSVNVISTGNITLRMTDMLGRSVYEKTYANQYGQIRDNIKVSELSKNVYTLQIISAKGMVAKRVVIE
jgi:hypothetical protein